MTDPVNTLALNAQTCHNPWVTQIGPARCERRGRGTNRLDRSMQLELSTHVKLCECGCGQAAPISASNQRGYRKGEPMRFVHTHNAARKTPHYLVDADTGCWLWQRNVTPRGYGRMRHPHHGRLVASHRYYYEQAKGPIPQGLHLDHLCRTPACVNPDHLEAVTSKENTRRGRRTKLSDADVQAIRASSDSARIIAERFGVVPDYVRQLRKGLWR